MRGVLLLTLLCTTVIQCSEKIVDITVDSGFSEISIENFYKQIRLDEQPESIESEFVAPDQEKPTLQNKVEGPGMEEEPAQPPIEQKQQMPEISNLMPPNSRVGQPIAATEIGSSLPLSISVPLVKMLEVSNGSVQLHHLETTTELPPNDEQATNHSSDSNWQTVDGVIVATGTVTQRQNSVF